MNNNLGKTVLFRMSSQILAVHQLVLATTATLLLALFAVVADGAQALITISTPSSKPSLRNMIRTFTIF